MPPAEILDMAKRGRPKKTEGDRHASRKVLRIGDDLHDELKDLADANDRPLVQEARRAIRHWIKYKGNPPECDHAD